MSSGFAWLNELMVWFGKWFPRIVLIRAGNVGLWFGPNGRTNQLAAGLYCYWPITSEIEVVSTRIRTTEIASQLQGCEVISIVVMFSISEPMILLLKFNDIFSQMDDRAQTFLRRAYGAEFKDPDIEESILENLRREFDPAGVSIHSVNLIQRGPVISLKNLNDWAQHSTPKL